MWPKMSEENAQPMRMVGELLEASILKKELEGDEEIWEAIIVITRELTKMAGERLIKCRRALAVVTRYELNNGCGND